MYIPRFAAYNNRDREKRKEQRNMAMFSLVLMAIGGINWGLVGLLGFDAVAWLCGGSYTVLARIIYTLVGAAAVYGLFTLTAKRECDR